MLTMGGEGFNDQRQGFCRCIPSYVSFRIILSSVFRPVWFSLSLSSPLSDWMDEYEEFLGRSWRS